MHQKQPPAKIALFVGEGDEVWARLESTGSAMRALKSRARARIPFIVVDLRQCRSRFVSLLGLLGRTLLSFLLSVPAGEIQSAHRPESFRGSPLIELESLVERLNPAKIFERDAPLHVDLGCGDGSFLCALAQRMPDKNFLGIERLLNRVRVSARKAATLDNVRLLRVESSYAVRYLLPTESVERFYLLFPDPWPKRRHHRRRIVTPDFLGSIHAALEKNGVIYIATDHLDYFRKIRKIAASTPGFESMTSI